MRLDKHWVERDGGVKAGNGFLMSLQGQQCHAAIVMRARILGFERDGGIEAGKGTLMVFEGAQHHAMVIVRVIIRWIDPECPTNELFGLFQMAALKAQHAQIVVGVKQIALRCDELAINALGTSEIAGLMRGDCLCNVVPHAISIRW